MAMGFIKKIFSFGKDAPEPVEPAPPAPVDHIPVPDAISFPHDDAAMAFTAETADEPDLSTPEPQDLDHAGEPPLVSDEAESAPTSDVGMVETSMEVLPDLTEVVLEGEDVSVPILPKGFANADAAPLPIIEVPKPKLTWYQRLVEGLSRTDRSNLRAFHKTKTG